MLKDGQIDSTSIAGQGIDLGYPNKDLRHEG